MFKSQFDREKNSENFGTTIKYNDGLFTKQTFNKVFELFWGLLFNKISFIVLVKLISLKFNRWDKYVEIKLCQILRPFDQEEKKLLNGTFAKVTNLLIFFLNIQKKFEENPMSRIKVICFQSGPFWPNLLMFTFKII